MTRPWDGNGWTEDLMRMEIPPRDADFGYDDLTLTPEQVEAWVEASPETVFGNPAARLDPADVGHVADLQGEW